MEADESAEDGSNAASGTNSSRPSAVCGSDNKSETTTSRPRATKMFGNAALNDDGGGTLSAQVDSGCSELCTQAERSMEVTAGTKKQLLINDTTALAYLAGDGAAAFDDQTLALKILDRIKQTVAKNPSMTLRGRTKDHFRINYGSDAKDITSVKSRMSSILLRTKDSTALNDLLAPLLSTNRAAFNILTKDSDAFGEHCLDETTYRSQWAWKPRLLKEIQALDKNKSHEIVDAVVDDLKKFCMKVDPESPLLRHPDELMGRTKRRMMERVRTWSLFGPGIGLSARLQECFDHEELTWEEYEDLIEQTMYRFKLANPSAVFGHRRGLGWNVRSDVSYNRNGSYHNAQGWHAPDLSNAERIETSRDLNKGHKPSQFKQCDRYDGKVKDNGTTIEDGKPNEENQDELGVNLSMMVDIRNRDDNGGNSIQDYQGEEEDRGMVEEPDEEWLIDFSDDEVQRSGATRDVS